MKYYMSNKKLLYVGYVLLNQSVNLSEQELYCNIVFQIGEDIQKLMNV